MLRVPDASRDRHTKSRSYRKSFVHVKVEAVLSQIFNEEKSPVDIH